MHFSDVLMSLNILGDIKHTCVCVFGAPKVTKGDIFLILCAQLNYFVGTTLSSCAHKIIKWFPQDNKFHLRDFRGSVGMSRFRWKEKSLGVPAASPNPAQ